MLHAIGIRLRPGQQQKDRESQDRQCGRRSRLPVRIIPKLMVMEQQRGQQHHQTSPDLRELIRVRTPRQNQDSDCLG